MHFLTIDDFDVNNKTILVRTDLNSPMDENNQIIDNIRLKRHSKTIKELSDKGAKVVVMSHQGRAGDSDLTRLNKHADLLSKHIGKNVKYIDDIFGTYAKESIKSLKKGEIILLENIRFHSEETQMKENQHNSHVVKELSPLIDYFVNDAFAAAHRAQVSLVGFSEVLPCFAGRVMQREFEILSKVSKKPDRPSLLAVGGSKIDDTMKVVKQLLKSESCDKIITSGLVGLVFLVADGKDIGDSTYATIVKKKADLQIPLAKRLLEEYKDKIELPVDLAICVNGNRVEIPVEKLPTDFPIFDIGEKTIEKYAPFIKKAATIIGNGPAGMFEKEGFDKGTKELLKEINKSNAYTVLGGGHLALAAEQMGFLEKVAHVSTGGGAYILYMAGEELPAVNALVNSAQNQTPLIMRLEEVKNGD
ncbi:MAG: phosphoglycerate kinase [Candidatus Aenigmarchaeota archaeon]|nr:phosphoglycerate kinase [Candidatus Aenigmarchaeota archaeon]